MEGVFGAVTVGVFVGGGVTEAESDIGSVTVGPSESVCVNEALVVCDGEPELVAVVDCVGVGAGVTVPLNDRVSDPDSDSDNELVILCDTDCVVESVAVCDSDADLLALGDAVVLDVPLFDNDTLRVSDDEIVCETEFVCVRDAVAVGGGVIENERE